MAPPLALPRRDTALDATRTFAIWLMVACHVARLVSKSKRPEWLELAMLIEPLCQALFMAMVGVSLVYSLRMADHRGETGWAGRQVERVLQLYVIGFVMFFAKRGWQWPWSVTSSGILTAIGEAMLLFLPLVLLARNNPRLGMALGVGSTLALAAIDYGLDASGVRLLVLNAGNGSLLPYAVLTGFGMLSAYVLLDGGRLAKGALAGALAVAAGVTLRRYGLEEVFDHPVGRVSTPAEFEIAGNGFLQLWKRVTGGQLEPYEASYYNFRPALTPLLMALCGAIYACFRLLRPVTDRLGPLWLVGRHSLGVYVLHLVLVAVAVVVAGKNRALNDPLQVQAGFGVITALCYGYAWAKERRERSRKAANAR